MQKRDTPEELSMLGPGWGLKKPETNNSRPRDQLRLLGINGANERLGRVMPQNWTLPMVINRAMCNQIMFICGISQSPPLQLDLAGAAGGVPRVRTVSSTRASASVNSTMSSDEEDTVLAVMTRFGSVDTHLGWWHDRLLCAYSVGHSKYMHLDDHLEVRFDIMFLWWPSGS